MDDLLAAAKAVDALWTEPDPGDPDEADGLIWMTEDEQQMAAALRGLRAALRERVDPDPVTETRRKVAERIIASGDWTKVAALLDRVVEAERVDPDPGNVGVLVPKLPFVALHREHGEERSALTDEVLDSGGYCSVDHQEWPCDAQRLLDYIAALAPGERADPDLRALRETLVAELDALPKVRLEPGAILHVREDTGALLTEVQRGSVQGQAAALSWVIRKIDAILAATEAPHQHEFRDEDRMLVGQVFTVRACTCGQTIAATPDHTVGGEEPVPASVANAMWAYQFAGSLTTVYDFADDDIVPLLDHLSAMAEGRTTGNEDTAAVPGSVARQAASERATPRPR